MNGFQHPAFESRDYLKPIGFDQDEPFEFILESKGMLPFLLLITLGRDRATIVSVGEPSNFFPNPIFALKNLLNAYKYTTANPVGKRLWVQW